MKTPIFILLFAVWATALYAQNSSEIQVQIDTLIAQAERFSEKEQDEEAIALYQRATALQNEHFNTDWQIKKLQ